MPQYEIYALKYAGPFTRTGAHLMWYQDWDKIETVNYYIWLCACLSQLPGGLAQCPDRRSGRLDEKL